MSKDNWTERPPATARIARRIWDFLTVEDGAEPRELWHNGNGMCFGNQLSDADYGAWKRDGGYLGNGTDVPEYIIIMAGATMGGLKLQEWYAKFNPKGGEYHQLQVNEFKRTHPGCKTYEGGR